MIMTGKLLEFISPLKKAGNGDFLTFANFKSPSIPPFSTGDVMSNLVREFLRYGICPGNIHAS
jgi:hypothetical protein